MAINQTAIAADLRRMIDDVPSTLVWGGNTVEVTATPVTREDDVNGDGTLQVADLEVYAVRADFSSGTTPHVRAVVEVDGVKYHVQEREVDAVGVRLALRRV